MDDMLGRLVSSDKAAIALATEEYLAIHAYCDTAEIPRTHLGGRLTAAQRVKLLMDKCLHFRGQVWKQLGALDG
jgi:hypothetical protein